jgi:hypothetical protein
MPIRGNPPSASGACFPLKKELVMSARPVTSKQLAFFKRLVGDEVYTAKEGELTALSSVAASQVIDQLLKTQREQSNTLLRKTPIGFHYAQGSVYRVRESSTGNMYATQFVQDLYGAWSFQYVGRKPFNMFSESTIMTLEQAQEFGKNFGICVRCGALLTDDVSIAQGMGPVCIKKWNQ